MATNGFYRPYTSDSDTDTISDSDSSSQVTDSTATGSTTSTNDSLPNFRGLAENLLTAKIGGPDFDASGNLTNQRTDFGSPLEYPGFLLMNNYILPPDPSGEVLDAANISLKATPQDVTSIIMLDSIDRDKSVYPQPTNVTLRLPRTYTSITNFQVVQIKFLSSFLYFRLNKNNTDISILELNRVLPDGTPNIIKTYIRPGSYSIDTLIAELIVRLNATPLFYDYPNGFQDFAPRFAATGDYSLDFNYPGDTYYDSLLDQYIPNPTMPLIISKYFQSQYAGRSSYTTDEIKVAYYYPAVKEILLDPNYVDQLNLNIVNSVQYLLPGETPRSRCIYTFQGLDDPVIQEVISLNIPLLDSYRFNHTFRYTLVNKYNVFYETQSNQIIISADSLNTSLVNLLNYKQAEYFAEQLNAFGITQDEYNAYQSQNTILLAVLNDMFYWLEKWTAVYYGINFNSYTINYMATATNVLPLRDGYNAVGISSNYDAAVVANNVVPQSNSILDPYRASAPQYWNRMKDLPESTIPFPLNLETGSPATSSNYPYSVLLEAQDRGHSFVDASGYLYANQLTRYADILVPIEASKYTVFRFKSPVRQTLQVETLPRPTKYRYPAYNAITYDLSHQQLFDLSYAFVYNAQNQAMDISPNFATSTLQTIPGFSNVASTENFGLSYTSSLALWGSNIAYLQAVTTRGFFTLQTPLPTDEVAPGYRYPLSLTLMNTSLSTFNTPMKFFLYHDRAAFMADISDNRNEKAIHYLSTSTASTDVSSVTMTFPVYGNQTYYVMARSISTIIPTVHYRVVPWFPDGSNYTTLTSSLTGFDPLANPQTPSSLSNINYAWLADPAFIQLPIQSSIQTTAKVDPLYSALTFSTFAIGYDSNGVSTDLTDYMGYLQGSPLSNTTPSSVTRMDPISGYSFQAVTPYNTSTQSYLGTGSQNAILTPRGASVYTPSTVAQRETSIVHWYGNTYIPNSDNQPPMLSTQIANSNYITPFTSATTPNPIAGYTYGGSNDAIQLGDGVMGISFIPGQGVWDIERMMFKSVYTTSNAATDANLSIRYLGVFFASEATVKYAHEFLLDEAIAVLQFSKAVTYTGSNQNLGFDQTGGTYYEYLRDTSFATGSNAYLYGYSQVRQQMNPDINSMYSFVPFDANKNLMTFQGVVGSLVPYPAYSDVSTSTTYFDGNSAPNGKDILIPVTKTSPDVTRGPPSGYDQTQSKYELSLPIGTTMLQYIEPYPIIQLSTTIYPFSPFSYNPTTLVCDESGFILTEDSIYRVYQYSADTTDYSLTERYQFTLDQVYPSNPAVNFLGVAANESNYAFFAYSNANLLVRTMNPQRGTIDEITNYSTISGFDPTVQQITNITYNNFGGFTMGLKEGSTFSAICKHSLATSSVTVLSDTAPTGFNANVISFLTRQSPKESAGSFYVFPYRTGIASEEAIVDYVQITPSNQIVSPNPNYTYEATTNGLYTQIATVNLVTADPPYSFRQPIVCRQPYRNDLFLLSQTNNQKFYQVTLSNYSYSDQFTYDAYTGQSLYTFPSAATTQFQGGNGSKWYLLGNTLYGSRNDTVDAPRKVRQSWQTFYPMQRIVFKQIAKNFTFMHNVDQMTYPEYPHTVMLGYNSEDALMADISGQWGLESSSNFMIADTKFSGNTFNSYFFTFPLEASTPSTPYYYLAVRNYSPTEKSQVLMRFSLNNKYDFGYVSFSDISDEIQTSVSTSNQYTPEYYASLQGFNSNFIFGSNGHVFGSNVVQGFPGSNFSNVTGFGDFYNQFTTIYSTYATQVQLIQTINNNVTSNLNAFIQSDLQYILPPSALNRQRYTDPLTFSILWKSALYSQRLNQQEEWGLGWNLGYAKKDTTYETVHRADSFYKILDDYINLRMNAEYDMNRMDITAKENLSQTLEPRGTTKAFHAKLLLANFGSYAQTLISNPITFSPSLARIDKLSFQWVDSLGNILDNADCEWNAVVQLVEKREVVAIPQPFRIDPSARVSERK